MYTKQITLHDIAHAAHVSPSTVSKALRDQSGVSPRVKDKIIALAQELGYESDRIPKSHTSWHTGVVGLVSADMEGKLSTLILSGAESTLGAKRHAIILASTHDDESIEESRIDQLLHHGIDGLIVVGKVTAPRPPLSTHLIGDLPTVYAWAPSKNPQDCSVTCNVEQAGYDAIAHLVACGRTRIAAIGGLEHALSTADNLRGVYRAFKDFGLSLTSPIHYGDWSSRWGRIGAERLLNTGVDFDGLYCFNDRIARGALEVLLRHSIQVPQQIAVLGYDNWDPQLIDAAIPLTSIDNGCRQVGSVAAQYLLDAIQGKPHRGLTRVAPIIVERESTPPLRKENGNDRSILRT